MIEPAVPARAVGIERTAIGGSRASLESEPVGKADTVEERLTLKVVLTDPFNPTTEIAIPIEVNKRFRRVITDRNVTTTLTGIVRKGLKHTYILEMQTSEWISDTNNNRDSATWRLELNRTQSRGPVSSFVYGRSVTLTPRAGR
jgi:hypothetical protein